MPRSTLGTAGEEHREPERCDVPPSAARWVAAWGRRPPRQRAKSSTVVVDQKNHRLMEVVEGRTGAELEAALAYIGATSFTTTILPTPSSTVSWRAGDSAPRRALR
jgi:hypothetical protein